MKLQTNGATLRVSNVAELNATNANGLRDDARAAMVDGLKDIEIDLSQTAAVDSCGVGALVALHKTATSRGGALRVLRPAPRVRQILELTRMNRIFEIKT